jgi:hypothetical protein
VRPPRHRRWRPRLHREPPPCRQTRRHLARNRPRVPRRAPLPSPREARRGRGSGRARRPHDLRSASPAQG